MIQAVSLSDPVQCQEWDAYVTRHPKGTIFHLSSWIRTVRDTYSFVPSLRICRTATGSVSGVLPALVVKNVLGNMRIVSLPFTDYCSILADDYDSEMEICRDLIQEGKIRGCILEIRNPTVMTETFKSCSYYKQHLLRLNEDPKAVFGNCDKKTIQYNIRKAQKAGIVVKEWNSDYGIRELYKLMNITRKRHGVPTQPKQYFDNIKKNIITPGLGSIFLASYNDRAIAAGLFLYHKNIVIYKYNASDCKNSGNLTPNHLLTWEAIRNACARGYGVLDFGRTSPDNAGLMRYKQMWGATAFALPYSFFPTVKSPSLVSESGNAYRLLRTVWRYLPMSITDILGKVLYRYTA